MPFDAIILPWVRLNTFPCSRWQTTGTFQNAACAITLDFHVRFESIHPFQDGNGRVGRLIMFRECLKHNIVPFIITEELKLFYYRGIKEWKNERGYLKDTCLTAQDAMKESLKAFGIAYE